MNRLRRALAMLARPVADPGLESRRMALLHTARRHLSALDKARQVLPGDPVIEAEYQRLARIVREADR
jgi:hypothetical protein